MTDSMLHKTTESKDCFRLSQSASMLATRTQLKTFALSIRHSGRVSVSDPVETLMGINRFVGCVRSHFLVFARMHLWALGRMLLVFTTRQRSVMSNHFRETYAWPLLESQRLYSNPTLRLFSTVSGTAFATRSPAYISGVVVDLLAAATSRESSSLRLIGRPPPWKPWPPGHTEIMTAMTYRLSIISGTSWTTRLSRRLVCDALGGSGRSQCVIMKMFWFCWVVTAPQLSFGASTMS
jgi:hypothetical protein